MGSWSVLLSMTSKAVFAIELVEVLFEVCCADLRNEGCCCCCAYCRSSGRRRTIAEPVVVKVLCLWMLETAYKQQLLGDFGVIAFGFVMCEDPSTTCRFYDRRIVTA